MFYAFKAFNELILLVFLTLLPIAGGSAQDARAAEPSPGDTERKFQSSLLAVVKEAEDLRVQQRFDRLEPSVEKLFHMPLIVRIASGEYSKQATGSVRLKRVTDISALMVHRSESYRLLMEPDVERLTAALGDKADQMTPGNRE
ncbi:MAG: hypothetical protein ISR51_07525 [Rhodospirillales bacterium]|nr:hypothetical protein [Alphaproteobacteria bacterium]MBL6948512.1 hypothetical protein [Rhodospirillales bacterium]